MRVLGEISLFVSLVATGYAAFLSVWRAEHASRLRQQIAFASAATGLAALTITTAVLAWALVSRDFGFEYVAQYASSLLPWRYCLSALWVGQAGSLLLWTWMTAAISVLLCAAPTADARLRYSAFGFLMGNTCFLTAVMIFAADPMASNPIASDEGAGLSPLLQHPSMLIHPPIVFLAYSVWAVPCAVAFAALWNNRLDMTWTQMARPWALSAWTLLVVGLLLGAHWAYQELGWGGYWGWDPVENGSLLPWLTGTALIHSLMTWRHRGKLKKSACSLAIVTFALCNFATFLTRSGIFSSVHAFSESPIGWMFLALMGTLLVGGGAMIARRRDALRGQWSSSSLLARETLIVISIFLLLLLAGVVLVGTLVAPLSKIIVGRTVQVGPEFYNNVLPPIGLGLLAMTAIVPLLQWGSPPTKKARYLLIVCSTLSAAAVLFAWMTGLRQPVALTVVGLSALTFLSLIACWLQEGMRRATDMQWRGYIMALVTGRRKYAAYAIHLGFVCVAIGIVGSSLGKQRKEVILDEGAVIDWAGRQIRHVRLEQRELPDKLVAESVLEIQSGESKPVELRPARHLHLLQNEWTTEVAIHSTWTGDFYTVLDAGLGEGRVALTLVSTPMIRWIWMGGTVTTLGAIVALLPGRGNSRAAKATAKEPLASKLDLAETMQASAA
jgi:cytochrome c-type biogenesis protein CcmF